jgi:hypothetical protein
MNSMGWRGLDSFGLDYGLVVKSCEDGNEPLGIIIYGKFHAFYRTTLLL